MKLNQLIRIAFSITPLLALESFGQTKNSHIIQMDPTYSEHVILVEKSTHSLFIYANKEGSPVKIKSYKIATGKKTGNKLLSGDKKTPEGIYHIKKFRSQDELFTNYGKSALIYGAGAFTMSYPNPFDQIAKKTGGGIWLHSTDNDQRVSKGLDSKGCVVATDKDIKEIADFIRLGKTTIIVTQNIEFNLDTTWEEDRLKLKTFFRKWSQAWQQKNFNEYISKYSKKEFFDQKKGNFSNYSRYKSYIFNKDNSPQISFSNISIFKFKDTAVIAAHQDYKSSTINDLGRKTLYLKKDSDYNWKIVNESWKKIDSNINEEDFFQAKTAINN